MGTVLIIDDADDVRAVLRACVEGEGHAVVEAPDGARGARLLGTVATDLVILDIGLPEIDGLSLLKQLRRRAPDLPVIIISGGVPPAPLEQSLSLADAHGADATLIKPFDIDDLLGALRRLMPKNA